MKNFTKVLLILFYFSLLQGCSYEKSDYITFENKPSLNYYSNEILGKIIQGDEFSLEIFDKDVYKVTKIDDSEKIIVEDFLNSLSNDNFKKYQSIDEFEPFQFRIIFNDSKYIIKIFDENVISISPWDGIFEEDIIYMTNVPERYNLYNFCVYVKDRVSLNQ